MLIVLIVLVLLAGVVAGVAQSVRNHTRLNREAKEQNLYSAADRSDIHSFVRRSPSRSVVHQCDVLGVRFALSADRKTAYLLYSAKQPTLTVPASKITGCKIIGDGAALSLGGAVAGGVIAGDAGALLGAVAGARIPLRYSLVIYLDDAARPSVEYALLTPSGSHAKAVYEAAARFADSVSASVRALTSQKTNSL